MHTFHLNSIKKNYPYSDAGELLVVPVIRRCSEFAVKSKKEYSFTLKKLKMKDSDSMGIKIKWNGLGTIPPKASIEDKTITEHAALGIAHIIFPQVIDKTIERTERNDGPDYWVGDDKEAMLEVSGMYKVKEKIESRVKKKEKRIRNSPFCNGTMGNADGYVSVTHFEQKISVLKHIPGVKK